MLKKIANCHLMQLVVIIVLLSLLTSIIFNFFGVFNINVKTARTDTLLNNLATCIDKPIEDYCIHELAVLYKASDKLPEKTRTQVRIAQGSLATLLFSRAIEAHKNENSLQELLVKWATNNEYIADANTFQPIKNKLPAFQSELKRKFLQQTIKK